MKPPARDEGTPSKDNPALDVFIEQQLVAQGKKPRQKRGLARAGELIASDPKLKPFITPTARQLRIVETADAVRQDPGDVDNATWMARQLVQATLPHSDPGDAPAWTRTNGRESLTIRPGWDHRANKAIGYPYGTIPRLLMFWLTTEIVRTNSRHIEMGRTLSEFMRKLGLDPDSRGPRSDYRRLLDQAQRLFRAHISFDQETDDHKAWLDMQIAPKGEMWWNLKQPSQGGLWQSWIEVSEEFFNAVQYAPVPVDVRALAMLRRSPLALDLYAWTVFKTYSAAKRRASQRVTWQQLHDQFGGDYKTVKDFKKKAKAALRSIRQVYPGLNLEEINGGLILHPGLPAIAEKAKA